MKIKNRFINMSSRFILLLGILSPVTLIFCAFSYTSGNQNSDLVECHIKIGKLKPIKSIVYIAIFDDVETFMGDKRFKSIRIENAGNSSVSQSFEIPKGKYAMAVFQDLNGNGKLDKNFIGIPSEPYGFSNNASGTFGPPSWDDALVNMDKETELEVDL